MYLHTQAVLHRILSPTLYSDNTSSVIIKISNKNTHTPFLCRSYWYKPSNIFVRYGKISQFRHWKTNVRQKCIFIFLWRANS